MTICQHHLKAKQVTDSSNYLKEFFVLLKMLNSTPSELHVNLILH